LSVSITPVARGGASHAGLAWPRWIEALVACAAVAALLPLFALLAQNAAGRDARFAAGASLQSVATPKDAARNAAKNEAMRELIRTAGWQWAGAMLLGLVFLNASRLRNAWWGIGGALFAWAVAAYVARVPWPIAGEHLFVPARESTAIPSLPASFVTTLLGAALVALVVGFLCRRALQGGAQTAASRVGYAGFVAATGIGFLLLLDLSANASYTNRYLALYHQGHLWLAMLTLSVVVFLRQPIGRALAWTLSMLDGVASGIGQRLGSLGSTVLMLALAAALSVSLGLALANLRQLTSEVGRLWLMIGTAWFFFMRGTPFAERLATSGSSLASLARYSMPLLFVVLVLVGAMFVTHDMGPLLIAGYAAGAFLAASIAMWMHARFRVTAVAYACAVLLFIGWIVLVTTALMTLGAIDQTTAGRLENLAAPLASANDQLALVTWFQQAAPAAGFGLGSVPWCGYGAAATACPGVPGQIQSDYTFTALVGVFGTMAAWLLTLGSALWLHRLIRHHGHVSRGEPRFVARSGRLVNDEQALLSWLALAWVVISLCQLAVTVAGNLAVIPLTGVTFPFVSFGMTSLVVNTAFLALAINVNVRGTD